jgi:hypothetical protein
MSQDNQSGWGHKTQFLFYHFLSSPYAAGEPRAHKTLGTYLRSYFRDWIGNQATAL